MTVDGVIVTPEERKGVQEHYEARLAVMDRYSDQQLQVKAAAGRRAQADGGTRRSHI